MICDKPDEAPHGVCFGQDSHLDQRASGLFSGLFPSISPGNILAFTTWSYMQAVRAPKGQRASA